MKHFLRLMILSVFLLMTFNFYGCSGDDGSTVPAAPSSDNTPTPTDTGDDSDDDAASGVSVTLAASETNILPSQTTTLTATCLDDLDAPVTSGTTVTFTLNNSTLGTLSSASATTNASGYATVLFTAGSSEGTAVFTATCEGETSSQLAVTIEEEDVSVTPTSITFNIASGTILMAGTNQVIQATLRDDGGLPMGQGIAVSFSIDDNNMGSLATFTDATNASGFAETAFTAANEEGTVTLTAQVGSALASIDIEVMREQPATIQFVDVTAEIIATKESGGIDFSTIRFQVKDGSGNPVEGESVEITISNGPGGGEYLGPAEEMLGIYEATTDAEGYASAIVHSGYVAGPLTIQAIVTVDDVVISAKPATMSIGGGIPNAERIIMGVNTFNVPGLLYVERTLEVTAYLADRYGDYNVLDGTAVNFMTEPGLAIFSTGIVGNDTGKATVTARTQGTPKVVVEQQWETDVKDYIDDLVTGTMRFSGHPTAGRCSVMAYAYGEEKFYDNDSNGLYDSEEDRFDEDEYDTFDDPFVDFDGDGEYDGDDPEDDNSEEDYFDSNNEGDSAGEWDGKNGVCDTHKAIFENIEILITGEPRAIIGDCSVPAGGSATLPIYVCDRNYNPLPAGTIVNISTDILYALMLGGGSQTLPETNYGLSNMAGMADQEKTDWHLSLIDHSITVIDNRSDTTEADIQYVFVSINWDGGKYYDFYSSYTLEAAPAP